MVGRVLISLTAPLVTGLMVLCACRAETGFPPRLETRDVSDTVQVIHALPSSGAVQISKNGYREFDLDAIVTDEDDADSTIRWSLSPGPLLNVNLNGSMAEVGPVPNQAGESYVVFTATDPGGLSASKTCPVSVFDSFRVISPEVDSVSSGGTKTDTLVYEYKSSLRALLVWGSPSFDRAYLDTCYLGGTPDTELLTVEARTGSVTTSVQFTVLDPVNHADFTYSIPVVVK